MNILQFFLYLIAFFPFSSLYIIPGLLSSLITWLLPIQLVSIYVKILLIFAVWWYIQIIQIPFPNNFNDRFGELEMQDEIFWFNIAIAVLAIIIKLSNTRSSNNTYSDVLLKGINYCIFTIFGLFSAYLLTLFHGDIFAGYQPAYQAYLLASLSIVIFYYFTYFITLNKQNHEFKNFKRYLQFFSYSLCGAMSALVVFSLSIPILVVMETNNIVKVNSNQEPEYCIQMLTSHEITTLLDLSPLTMWSKAELGSSYGWGKPYFHSLLIVKNKNYTDLYNWSYRQKKWTYLKPGFAKIASIDEHKIVCTPRKNYLQQIPWIFPR